MFHTTLKTLPFLTLGALLLGANTTLATGHGPTGGHVTSFAPSGHGPTRVAHSPHVHKPPVVHTPRVVHRPPAVHAPRVVHRPPAVHTPRVVHMPPAAPPPRVWQRYTSTFDKGDADRIAASVNGRPSAGRLWRYAADGTPIMIYDVYSYGQP